MQSLFVAIVGPSASGKTTLAAKLKRQIDNYYAENICSILSEDAYYKDQNHLSFEQRCRINYDHPEAFEHKLLEDHLLSLRQHQAVQMPIYDYGTHSRTADSEKILPKKIILIEGILLLSQPRLRKQFNTSVYIDTPLDVCLSRRIIRDIKQRQRSLDSVLTQYNQQVRPMYLEFVQPSIRFADYKVCGTEIDQACDFVFNNAILAHANE